MTSFDSIVSLLISSVFTPPAVTCACPHPWFPVILKLHEVNSLDNFNEPSTDDDIDSTEADDDFESDEESEDDMLDLTGASDDEVLKVFKAMKPEDGIVVKKDGNNNLAFGIQHTNESSNRSVRVMSLFT